MSEIKSIKLKKALVAMKHSHSIDHAKDLVCN